MLSKFAKAAFIAGLMLSQAASVVSAAERVAKKPIALPAPTHFTTSVEVSESVTDNVDYVPVAAEPDAVLCPGCGNGACPPYYRNRPRGHKGERRRISLQNRLLEPDWYRVYRREHFGYYPTQWNAWPDGWMNCRYPHPGAHPYDLKQPESKKPAANAPRNSTANPPARPEIDAPPAVPPPVPGDLKLRPGPTTPKDL